MKTMIGTIMFALVAIMLFAGSASAKGDHTAAQLVKAGYICVPAGPYDWIHCADFGRIAAGKPAVPVQVFSINGLTFYGTEQLLRADLYAGQRCFQDELESWDDGAVPGYVACHHYYTDHNSD